MLAASSFALSPITRTLCCRTPSAEKWRDEKVSEVAPEEKDECVFEDLGPEAAAKRRADVVVLAVPDGATADYIDAIETHAPKRIIVDISADRRFDDEWEYGLPELFREKLKGAKRIANPGCYATAMQLALAPLAEFIEEGPAVFGVSGYSGAGVKPSPRNDPDNLRDNIIPYALVGHNHEREARRHLGLDVRFTPHVHPAFRGLITTCSMKLKDPTNTSDLKKLYDEKYAKEKLIRLRDAPPELRDGANISGAIIGGFQVGEDQRSVVVVSAIDNLLKGAAVQAMQNVNLALGVKEYAGILEGGA